MGFGRGRCFCRPTRPVGRPRCFVLASHDCMLILHVHVDDGRLTYTTRIACDRYRQAWAKEFDEALGPLGETDFTGLRHSLIG